MLYLVSLAFQDQMACLECRAFPDRKDPREEKAEREKLVIRDRKECRVQEEKEGPKGFLERADPKESKEQKVYQDLWELKESQALWERKVSEE